MPESVEGAEGAKSRVFGHGVLLLFSALSRAGSGLDSVSVWSSSGDSKSRLRVGRVFSGINACNQIHIK